MVFHKGRNSTYSKISEQFIWYSIHKNIKICIKTCENFKKQGDFKLKINSELHGITVLFDVMM